MGNRVRALRVDVWGGGVIKEGLTNERSGVCVHLPMDNMEL